MTGEERNLVQSGRSPVVALRRIGQIDTYEVMESDLQALETASHREQMHLGFLTFCAGVLIPTVISLLTASSVTAVAAAVYAAAISVFSLATVYFLISWRQEAKLRPRLLARIRSSAISVEQSLSMGSEAGAAR